MGAKIHTERAGESEADRTTPPKGVRLRKAEIETKLVRSPFGAVRPPKKTLEEFSREWTAARRADSGISPKTLYEEGRLLARHVLPEFGSYQLGRISPGDVEKFLARVASGSAWTARAVRILLRKMMADARRLRYVADNPVADTRPIMPRSPERRMWDAEQVRMFLGEARRYSTASGRPVYSLFLFLLLTGLRPGEALALRRQDVDLALGYADVARNLLRVGREVVFKSPKTPSGRRRVELGPLLVEELRRHLDSHGHELVFCQEDGKPLHEHNVAQRDFRRVTNLDGLRKELKAKGIPEDTLPKPLPRIRLYDLRHLHSSLGAFLGIPPKVMQERLGHASPAITLAVYTHTMGNAHRAAAAVIEEAILSKLA